MRRSKRISYAWEGSATLLDRLAKANERALPKPLDARSGDGVWKEIIARASPATQLSVVRHQKSVSERQKKQLLAKAS